MGLCIGCFEWVADMKKITVQDRAEKFINELGKYAVGNFKEKPHKKDLSRIAENVI